MRSCVWYVTALALLSACAKSGPNLPDNCSQDWATATIVPVVNIKPKAGATVKVGEPVVHRFEVDGAPLLFSPATLETLDGEDGDHSAGDPTPSVVQFEPELTQTLLVFEAPEASWSKAGLVRASIYERYMSGDGCWWRLDPGLWSYSVVEEGGSPDAGGADAAHDAAGEAGPGGG